VIVLSLCLDRLFVQPWSVDDFSIGQDVDQSLGIQILLNSKSSCSRFSHQESGILGKWRAYSDSQSLSYDKLPDGNILSRVAGFENFKTYRPYWFQIQPPDCLMELILPMFIEEREKAKKVNLMYLPKFIVLVETQFSEESNG